MKYFKGRYRIGTIRLAKWDYSAEACYFVTICTAHRARCFGAVMDGTMHLSDLGAAARDEWLRSAKVRTNVVLGDFVIMPDHMHGIVILSGESGASNLPVEADQAPVANQFGPLRSGSLQSMVNGYKGSVTRWARRSRYADFAWQPGYWDTLVRSTRQLDMIRRYIANNPVRWVQ